MKIIVSVCRGNIFRSAIAEKIIAKELHRRKLDDIYISLSRSIQGTRVDTKPVDFPNITFYKEYERDYKPILEKLGIDLSTHISTPIDKNTAEKACILIAMDNKTKQALQILFPDQTKKIHLLSELVNKDRDITDPQGMCDKEKQIKIITEIREIILHGFSKLINLV